MPEAELWQTAERTLRRLRIGGKLKGLRYLTYAITETVKNPYRTEGITKDLYHEIARKYGVTASKVERNIRKAICVSWTNAKKELDQMAGYHLVKRPTNSEFIDLVAYYIRSL